jgi:hypothetical protein
VRGGFVSLSVSDVTRGCTEGGIRGEQVVEDVEINFGGLHNTSGDIKLFKGGAIRAEGWN